MLSSSGAISSRRAISSRSAVSSASLGTAGASTALRSSAGVTSGGVHSAVVPSLDAASTSARHFYHGHRRHHGDHHDSYHHAFHHGFHHGHHHHFGHFYGHYGFAHHYRHYHHFGYPYFSFGISFGSPYYYADAFYHAYHHYPSHYYRYHYWRPDVYYYAYPYYAPVYVAYPHNYASDTVDYEVAEVSYEPRREVVRPQEYVEPSDTGVVPVSAPSDASAVASSVGQGGEVVTDAQRSFGLGLLHLQRGDFSAASESFYLATLDAPGSDLAKVALAVNLFAIAEYEHAAEYLRGALAGWDGFPNAGLDLRKFYGDTAALALHTQRLSAALELNPSDRDVRLVYAFVLFHSGERDAAAAHWDALDDLPSKDPAEAAVVARYLRTYDAAAASEASSVSPEIRAFLDDPDFAKVSALPLE